MQTLEKPNEVSLLHSQIHCFDDQTMVFLNSVPYHHQKFLCGEESDEEENW